MSPWKLFWKSATVVAQVVGYCDVHIAEQAFDCQSRWCALTMSARLLLKRLRPKGEAPQSEYRRKSVETWASRQSSIACCITRLITKMNSSANKGHLCRTPGFQSEWTKLFAASSNKFFCSSMIWFHKINELGCNTICKRNCQKYITNLLNQMHREILWNFAAV